MIIIPYMAQRNVRFHCHSLWNTFIQEELHKSSISHWSVLTFIRDHWKSENAKFNLLQGHQISSPAELFDKYDTVPYPVGNNERLVAVKHLQLTSLSFRLGFNLARYNPSARDTIVRKTIITNTNNRKKKFIYVFSKVQLVVYYQCCVLIGWATTRLYVIAH